MPYEAGKIVHRVMITSAVEPFDLPQNAVSSWEGFVSAGCPVAMVWHNSTVADEVFITIGEDILIHHMPESKITACYLREKKSADNKLHRPALHLYVFLLIHNILSMYDKYCIHSACVAKNGFAYLFLGKSGQGKTTLSNLLSNAGFDYMGDDLTFISRNETGEIVVDSLLCAAKIVKDAPEGNLEKNIVDVIGKHHYTCAYRRKLGAVFMLHRSRENESHIRPTASQGSIYGELIHSGNNIKMQHHPQRWLDICEQAATLPAYDMFFGNKEYFNPGIFNTVINNRC